MSYKDVVLTSLFFQFALYVMVRLARQGFTVGELGLVAQGATVIFVEVVNYAWAKVKDPLSTTVWTFRFPTPLLVFQHALLPGSLLVGFLLSPLLYLSRHTASRRVRRRDPTDDKKWRRENIIQRWFLAIGFYLFAALLVGGPIGIWTRWCLDQINPWVWVLHWLLAGKRVWVRPFLLVYWGLLASISVWGWNRRLVRVRKSKTRRLGGNPGVSPVPVSGNTGTASEGEASTSRTSATATTTSTATVAAAALSTAASTGAGAIVSGIHTSQRVMNQANEMAAEFLDAADKRVPTLTLNARRKYFHGLAVLMFLPGIAIDVSLILFRTNHA